MVVAVHALAPPPHLLPSHHNKTKKQKKTTFSEMFPSAQICVLKTSKFWTTECVRHVSFLTLCVVLPRGSATWVSTTSPSWRPPYWRWTVTMTHGRCVSRIPWRRIYALQSIIIFFYFFWNHNVCLTIPFWFLSIFHLPFLYVLLSIIPSEVNCICIITVSPRGIL